MKNIDAFYQNMSEMLYDYDKYTEYEKNGVVSRGIRVNTLKIDINGLKTAFACGSAPIELNLKESGFAEESFFTDAGATKHPYYHAGLYYSQEPSASCTIEALRPYIGNKILDMCAAPGGKTTQIAALLNGNGVIVANDIIFSRAKILRSNIERAGIRNAVVTNNSPKELGEAYGGYFDTVIVDAPCSGEGMFLKEPQAKEMWSREYVIECAERQYSILENADKCLKCGGYLVYSTCTFNRIENESIIEKFSGNYNYELINIENIKNCSKSAESPETIKIYPHRHGGLGHFVALMRKRVNCPEKRIKFVNPFNKHNGQNAEKIFSGLSNNLWGEIYEYKDGLYITPQELPIAKGINVLSAGVKIFDVLKGGRLEPHHAFAMAIRKNEAVKTINLSKEEAYKYIAGETLPAINSEKGFALAAIDGYGLGFVKISEGQAKNRLPKGLRINTLIN